jgi:hypothetical protein
MTLDEAAEHVRRARFTPDDMANIRQVLSATSFSITPQIT